MLLSQLMKSCPDAVFSCDGEVSGIISDSRKVTEGSLFICIKGARFDGHSVAADVLDKGACAVVVERDLGLERQVLVTNTRTALAKLCSGFMGRPQDKLRMVAVTGTNGKTTIANIIKKSLEHMGHMTGLIGTIGSEIGDVVLPAQYTTPEPWDLEVLLNRMVRSGCEFAVMEASSQALDQGRLDDIRYECGVFTNLSQDHLDYHKNFENYLNAKKLLFRISDKAVINEDDPAGRDIIKGLDIPYISYSMNDRNAELYASEVRSVISGSAFELKTPTGIERCSVNLPGIFSVYNAMAAIGALIQLGFGATEAAEAVASVQGVSGRCEVLYSGDVTVISDYAHTDDALRKILSSLKPYVKGRLIALFGCAGQRDSTKRVPMIKAITEYADYVVFSADNPRNEDPAEIMRPLLKYAEEKNLPYALMPDRFWAIKWMLTRLQPGDVFVLCCKGHEDYQVLDGVAVYLDERRIVKDYYSGRN